MNDDGRRPRLYRPQSAGSKFANVAVFVLAVALIVAVALTLYVGLGVVLAGR